MLGQDGFSSQNPEDDSIVSLVNAALGSDSRYERVREEKNYWFPPTGDILLFLYCIFPLWKMPLGSKERNNFG